jgi:hypothetical protein
MTCGTVSCEKAQKQKQQASHINLRRVLLTLHLQIPTFFHFRRRVKGLTQGAERRFAIRSEMY